jgi:excisionase family DNA binding protein
MNTGVEDKLISVREAAKECGRNPETIRRWIWSGKLPAEKLGNQLFVKRSILTDYCREIMVPLQDQRENDTEKVVDSHNKPAIQDLSGVNEGASISGAAEERRNGLEQSQQKTMTAKQPGSRADVIGRLIKLREEIREKTGDLDIDDFIDLNRGAFK